MGHETAAPTKGFHNHELFRKLAHKTSAAFGSPLAFVVAVLIVLGWGLSGPIFGFSDTWQLVINTGTTIVTFLCVFMIQNTQNRDSRALHLKMDELIRAVATARNSMIDAENMPDDELARLEADVRTHCHDAPDATEDGESGGVSTETPPPGATPPVLRPAKPSATPRGRESRA